MARRHSESMSKPIRSVSIVVADDHPIVLGGLVTLLKQDKSLRLVATCANGQEAIDAIRALKPDIALLDLNMPRLNGLQVSKTLIAENLPTRVCFLAASLTDTEIVSAATSGAFGIILKESAPDTLITALHAIAAGQKWLPSDFVNGASERLRKLQAEVTKITDALSPREIEIMLRVAEGLSNKEVGRLLKISEGTVKMHLHSIYQKIDVSNRTSLANFATAYRDRLAAVTGNAT
jgi:two-component system, NarL family, nitrate/nitrite response regulator NarL